MSKKYLVTEEQLNELVIDALVAARRHKALYWSTQSIGVELPPDAVPLTREQVEAAMWLASDRIQKALKAGNVGQGDSFQEYMLDELFGKTEAGE